MGQLGISLFYVVPVLLLALIWRSHQLHTRWKILLLVVLPCFYVGHWVALESREGWPVNEPLPAKFNLLDASIVEPDRQKKHAGAIYIWAQRTDQLKPRSYALPYNRELHIALHQSLQTAATRPSSDRLRFRTRCGGQRHSGR